MKTLREGDWFVTSPVFAGGADGMAKFAACKHVYTVTSENHEQWFLVITEKCSCGAVRLRYGSEEIREAVHG